uniref:Uncharacterized protein n=1 Tax=Ditylenchus dipsaci TaxID=166011 RepID=A0A915CTT6_9BILA
MLEGGRLTRPIGRDGSDLKIAGSQRPEILGDMCLDMSYDSKSKLLMLAFDFAVDAVLLYFGPRVLDYTVWPLNSTISASQNLQRLQDTNNLKAGVGPGRLYLRTCISSDKSLLSSMKKSRVVERRTLESIRLDCSQLFSSSSTSSKPSRTYQEDDKSPIPKINNQANDPTKLPPKPPKSRSHQVPAAANQRISFKPTGQEDNFEGHGHSLSVSSASASSSTVTTPNWKMAGTNSTPTPTPALDAGGNTPGKTAGNFFFPSTSSAGVSATEKEPSKLSEHMKLHMTKIHIAAM